LARAFHIANQEKENLMAIPATIDQLDDAPEALRPYYLETEDGRFRLDAEGVEDVAGLKSALEKERAARKALKAERDALAGAVDPEHDDADDAEASREDERSDEQVREAEIAEPVEVPAVSVPVISPDAAAAAALRQQLEARLVEAEATAAIIAASGVPELLLPVVLPRLAVHGEDGAFEVRVIASDGDLEDTQDIADLVEGLRRSEIYGRAFDGVGKSGSGAPSDSAGGGGTTALPAGDPLALGRHLSDIASGRVTVEG
jgi:hypothetical protein